MKSRSNKFVTDILIYGIGNLGSKLMTFLLVPLYTYFIDTKDFGYYDLILNFIFLAIPFVTFQLRDGAFRMLLDNVDNTYRKNLITYIYKFISRNILICLVIAIVISLFLNYNLLLESFLLLISMSVYEVQIQIVRGLDSNKLFVIVGIFCTFCIGMLSLFFIVICGFGIEGIFWANILARMFSILFIEVRLGLFKNYFFYKFNDKNTNKELLHYSLPLLPNVLCWAFISFANRLFILHYIGIEQNGMYAVSIKFASILETFTVIIYQAWQETAIRQYNSKDRNVFFSKVFNNYFLSLVCLSVCLALSLKLIYPLIVSNSYNDSLQYIYINFVVIIFYALSMFFDLGYQCSKKTYKMLPSVIIATIINLSLNYLLITHLQNVYGIILSSLFTMIFLFSYRIIDTKKFFIISPDIKLIHSFVILLIGGVFFYIKCSEILVIAFIACTMFYFITSLPNELRRSIINKFNK